jgi:environmental stress-induced protein Ves
MSPLPPTVVRVADVAPVTWRNGGGMTRELLAWPDPQGWLLRVSVADIQASGPFSDFPDVDRWFAVLEGGAVRLHTAGTEAKELSALDPDLHFFPGDVATSCAALGDATRDLNLMARRSYIRLRQQPLQKCRGLETRSALAGLFVAQAAELRQDFGPIQRLPALTLAWWRNTEGAMLSLNVESRNARGWWFEVDTRLRHTT